MNYRENTLLKQTGASTKPDWAAGYTVTVYPVGAICSSGAAAAAQSVDNGHGFIAGDKALIDPGVDNIFTVAVASVAAGQVTFNSSVTTSTGDKLVNLGPDGGSSTPNYTASPMVIYSDADGSSVITNSTVTCSVRGEYSYYHRGDGKFWELIRDASGAVVDVIAGFGGISRRLNTVDFGDLGDGSVTARVTAALLAIQVGEDMLHYGMTTPFTSFTSLDTTPSVKGRRFFHTANAGSTVISMFDDGIVGQEIFVHINDANTTIDFTGTNLKGNLGVNWTPTTNDSMICVFDGTNWYCDVSDNTA